MWEVGGNWREGGHLWKPKCDWHLGAQRAPSIRSPHARMLRCARIGASCVCLRERAAAAEDAWSVEPSCPSRHSQSLLHRGPPTGPGARHTRAHARQRHTSVSQCGWGPITKPANQRTGWNPQKTCGASATGLAHTRLLSQKSYSAGASVWKTGPGVSTASRLCIKYFHSAWPRCETLCQSCSSNGYFSLLHAPCSMNSTALLINSVLHLIVLLFFFFLLLFYFSSGRTGPVGRVENPPGPRPSVQGICLFTVAV